VGLKRELTRNFMSVGGMKLLGIPISLVIAIILARVLGPEDFGRYAFIMALVPLLALSVSGGVSQLLTREVATYIHLQQWSLYNGLLKSSHVFVLLLSTIFVVGFFTVSSWTDLIPQNETKELFSIAIWLVPFLGLAAIRLGFIKGLHKPALAELPQQFLQPIILLVVVGGTAWLGGLDTFTAIWIQVFAASIVFIVATWIFYKIQPKEAFHKTASYRNAEWGKALLPFSFLAVVTTLNAHIGIIFLGVLSSNEDVAAMRVAERGAQLVVLSLTIVNMVIAPYIVKAYQENNKKVLQKIARKSAQAA
jgi:O-antigen/teichoic acid export membrane protein